VGSTLGLIALSPLFLLLAIYIKIVSPGPVFFRQKRVGLAHKEFDFFKFRTLHHNNKEEVHSHHAKDFIHFDKPMTKLDGIDPRIIKGGRILRKLAVDELPQLWNILKGDMSLVGPRPCIPYEADEYLQWHTDRFAILPGLTGLWQVSGKNELSFQQMIRLDIEYSRRMSLWYDLWIILRTFPTVIKLGIDGTTHRLKVRQQKRVEQAAQEQKTDETAKVYQFAPESNVRHIAK
jgi:lipopolysaccharide/colanic/teichoic acid biosynthesis glycosyltransferase